MQQNSLTPSYRYFFYRLYREIIAYSKNMWGPSGGKNRSALRPFLTSPLRAPTLFDIAALRSTIFLRSKLRPFLHQRSALRPFFESVLRAPTFLHQRSALRHMNTKNRRSALRPILPLALRTPVHFPKSLRRVLTTGLIGTYKIFR